MSTNDQVGPIVIAIQYPSPSSSSFLMAVPSRVSINSGDGRTRQECLH